MTDTVESIMALAQKCMPEEIAQTPYDALRAAVERVIRERDTLAAAAHDLVANAEEYECDGLGLFAQHGWWEPLHDALEIIDDAMQGKT